MNCFENNSLAHHGILGMKWGIRRYQNRNGSLTPAGRKRAYKLQSEYRALTKHKIKGDLPPENPNTKSVKQLTNKELSDRITRLQNEKTALGLEKELSGKGKKFVRSVGRDVVAPSFKEAGKSLLTKLLINQGTKILNLNAGDVDTAFKQLKRDTETLEYKKRKMKAENDLKQMIEKSKQDASKKEMNKQESSKQDKSEAVIVSPIKTNNKLNSNSSKIDLNTISTSYSRSNNSGSLTDFTEDKKKGKKYINLNW